MNILVVASKYFPMRVGYSTRLHGIVSQLAKQENDVTILTPRYNIDLSEYERITPMITIVRYPYRNIFGIFSFIKKIKFLLNSKKYDLISGHSPTKNAFAAYIFSFLYKIPFVFVIHYSLQSMNEAKKSIKYYYYYFFEYLLLRNSNKIVVISNAIKDDLLARGIRSDKIIVLPNSVDFNLFSLQSGNEIKRKYNVTNDSILLFIGSFQAHEELDKILEVLYNIKTKRENVKLFLVGDGPELDKIKNKIRELNLKDDVVLTGFVPFSDVPKYYAACDVFLIFRSAVPLLDKTTPIKPIEAMAMGKVVVSTDVGGMREIIDDGKTGFLVPHSVTSMAEKIIEILDDSKLREEIGLNARTYVMKNRNWDFIIKNLISAYKDAIEHDQRKRN